MVDGERPLRLHAVLVVTMERGHLDDRGERGHFLGFHGGVRDRGHRVCAPEGAQQHDAVVQGAGQVLEVLESGAGDQHGGEALLPDEDGVAVLVDAGRVRARLDGLLLAEYHEGGDDEGDPDQEHAPLEGGHALVLLVEDEADHGALQDVQHGEGRNELQGLELGEAHVEDDELQHGQGDHGEEEDPDLPLPEGVLAVEGEADEHADALEEEVLLAAEGAGHEREEHEPEAVHALGLAPHERQAEYHDGEDDALEHDEGHLGEEVLDGLDGADLGALGAEVAGEHGADDDEDRGGDVVLLDADLLDHAGREDLVLGDFERRQEGHHDGLAEHGEGEEVEAEGEDGDAKEPEHPERGAAALQDPGLVRVELVLGLGEVLLRGFLPEEPEGRRQRRHEHEHVR